MKGATDQPTNPKTLESICIYEIADKGEKLYHTKRNVKTGGVELISKIRVKCYTGILKFHLYIFLVIENGLH